MATDINSVVVVGRLTKDAELKYTSGGMAICNFSLANNYSRKQGDSWKDEVNYFDAVMFSKRAEALHKYLVKGKQVAIKGQLRQDRWEKDGQKRSRVQIVIDDLNLLGGGESSGRSDGGNRTEEPYDPKAAFSGGSGSDFEDDVPF